MKAFMDKDFLLDTDTAKMLYHDYAGKLHIDLEKGNTVLNGKQAVGYLRTT